MAAINAEGGTALAVAADLGRTEDRARLVDTVTRELGPVDVLVNNAAVTHFEPVTEFRENHYHLMFEVQVRAPFDLAQQVLPGMRERRSGWILNISSPAAIHPQGPLALRLVPTPGVVHHHLDEMIPEETHEPASYMAEASYALCTGDPATLTGRIAFSRTLLDDLGIGVPA